MRQACVCLPTFGLLSPTTDLLTRQDDRLLLMVIVVTATRPVGSSVQEGVVLGVLVFRGGLICGIRREVLMLETRIAWSNGRQRRWVKCTAAAQDRIVVAVVAQLEESLVDIRFSVMPQAPIHD